MTRYVKTLFAVTIFSMLSVLAIRYYPIDTRAAPSHLAVEECSTRHDVDALSCDEIALLTERERLLTRYTGTPKSRKFVEQPSETFLQVASHDPSPTGYRYLASTGIEITVSDELERPTFDLEQLSSGLGNILVTNGKPDDQLYFELSTDPTFNGPKIWRWPSLKPKILKEDNTTAAGATLYLFNLTTANYDLYSRNLKLPFAAEMMSVSPDQNAPLSSMQQVVDLTRTAVDRQISTGALPAGEADVEMVRMIHRYIQHGFLVASDSYNKPPVETFLSRNGECGNLNTLAQAMLELAGIRSRLVIGFNPTIRQILPYGGHTLVEVHYPHGWGILDTYLDLFSPMVSVTDLANNELGNRPVLSIDNTKYSEATYGSKVTLNELFRYRFYGDGAQRLPMQSMLQLGEHHSNYGRYWPLRKVKAGSPVSTKVPDAKTSILYVRARFIRSTCRAKWNTSCADPNSIASAWAVKSINLE